MATEGATAVSQAANHWSSILQCDEMAVLWNGGHVGTVLQDGEGDFGGASEVLGDFGVVDGESADTGFVDVAERSVEELIGEELFFDAAVGDEVDETFGVIWVGGVADESHRGGYEEGALAGFVGRGTGRRVCGTGSKGGGGRGRGEAFGVFRGQGLIGEDALEDTACGDGGGDVVVVGESGEECALTDHAGDRRIAADDFDVVLAECEQPCTVSLFAPEDVERGEVAGGGSGGG